MHGRVLLSDDYKWCETCEHTPHLTPVVEGMKCFSCEEMESYSRDPELILFYMDMDLASANHHVRALKEELDNYKKEAGSNMILKKCNCGDCE